MPKEKTQGNVTVQSQNDNATQRVPENERILQYCICGSGVLHMYVRPVHRSSHGVWNEL